MPRSANTLSNALPNGPTYRQPDECPHGNRRHCIAYSVADRQPHGRADDHPSRRPNHVRQNTMCFLEPMYPNWYMCLLCRR